MPFAAAISEHPVTAYAVGEVVGEVLERLGHAPDVALLFVTLAHAGALEDAMATVRAILEPRSLVGCASAAVVGTAREVENGAAVSLWAGHVAESAAVRLTAAGGARGDGAGAAHGYGAGGAGGLAFRGWPDPLPFDPAALVLLADPYSFAADEFLADTAARWPGLQVIGGMATGARGPGGTRLAVGERVLVDGAVGVLLGRGARVSAVVSQGCRPIGRPLVVTDSHGDLIRQLAGAPPMERLADLAPALPPDDIRLINRSGLHLGIVIDEHQVDFERGDFLVRSVIGAEEGTGAIKVDEAVAVGTTVQFHVRDAASADEDLRLLLADAAAAAPAAALLFTCNGRGVGLFGEADHDAGAIADFLGRVPTAGMSANGEFGPVAGHNFVHGFTASIALFAGPA